MENKPIPVPLEATRAFTEIAQWTRVCWHMLKAWGDPAPGSRFEQMNDIYPFEKVSDRARHYISAALEHLLMWADFAVPFKFHPEQTTNVMLRPPMALARAALESAAQAVWLMDGEKPLDCVQRHLRLIRWDLAEHRKSHLEAAGKDRVKRRDAELVARVANAFTEEQILPPQGYLWVIQQACRPDDLDLAAPQAERLWRAMSGAAHGMYWTNLDLMHVEVGEEYEPGHYRTVTVPNLLVLAEALQVGFRMTQYGCLKYLEYAGADLHQLMGPALRWLAENITVKPDADPRILRRLVRNDLQAED
ncbi:hypothetical protein [Granulicoccus sp. GXG6511]|uniref:hypothetical protein n=1 Tax=Granulicoccus sp. GXG6511 TaxID=3381351 RepID=UPI003D7D4BC5